MEGEVEQQKYWGPLSLIPRLGSVLLGIYIVIPRIFFYIKLHLKVHVMVMDIRELIFGITPTTLKST